MPLSFLDFLRHILDETGYLVALTGQMDKEQFLVDETAKRAVARSIEIIGEAVKKVPADVQEKYPSIEWRIIAGMRDKLIHHYFGVDYEIVWDVAKNKAPVLQSQIKEIIEDYFEQ